MADHNATQSGGPAASTIAAWVSAICAGLAAIAAFIATKQADIDLRERYNRTESELKAYINDSWVLQLRGPLDTYIPTKVVVTPFFGPEAGETFDGTFGVGKEYGGREFATRRTESNWIYSLSGIKNDICEIPSNEEKCAQYEIQDVTLEIFFEDGEPISLTRSIMGARD